jgi:hypothetical protein
MNDTPQSIKEIQLKIWLSKSPMERLKKMMEDNASLMQFWANTRKSNKDQDQKPDEISMKY